jgi:hypothetical protein
MVERNKNNNTRKENEMLKRCLFCVTMATIMVAGAFNGYAQELTGPPASPQYKYSTPMPPGIAMRNMTHAATTEVLFSATKSQPA